MKSKEDYLAEIEALSSVKDDWNSYGSKAPNQNAINMAKVYIDAIVESKYDAKSYPEADGGVGIMFRNGKRYGIVETTNEPDGYDNHSEYLTLQEFDRSTKSSTSMTFPIHENYRYAHMKLLEFWLEKE
jgi:hypothetical protein